MINLQTCCSIHGAAVRAVVPANRALRTYVVVWRSPLSLPLSLPWQEAQAAEAAAQAASRAADERAADAAKQAERIAASQAELAAAQHRLQQRQAELEVTTAACGQQCSWRRGSRRSFVFASDPRGVAVIFPICCT